MNTFLMLLENMSHSTLPGFFGVSGIVLFLIGMVAAGLYRVRESSYKKDH